MDAKGKYMLSLGAGALLGSAATLATSKLLLRIYVQDFRFFVEGFLPSDCYYSFLPLITIRDFDEWYVLNFVNCNNSTDKTANYIEVLGIHLKWVIFARLSPLDAPSATVVVKGLPQKTTEEDLYQILGAAQTVMDMFGHEGILVYDSKLFFEYSFGILGVTGGLFQPHLGEKMLRKPFLECFLVATGVVVAVMRQPLLQPPKSDMQNY
ncbi:hypothetical protein OROMI_008567 [Orobanche minor]